MDNHRKTPAATISDPFELAYTELHGLAANHMMGERPSHTLQPTALINEAFLKLNDRYHWENRNHFMAVASKAMRQILLDHARRRNSAKRKGQIVDVPIGDIPQTGKLLPSDLLEIDQALSRLGDRKPNGPRHARLIELVYFGGMTITAAAEQLTISRKQAQRDWAFARLFLEKELTNA